MLANLVNTLIGIIMVYAAVLAPQFIHGDKVIASLVGLAIIGLALWSRMSDAARWFSATIMAVGGVVLLLALAQLLTTLPSLVMFWGVFWCGTIVAVVALWAALYRPREQAFS